MQAPATLIFDHPTVAALAAWLAGQLAPISGSTPDAAGSALLALPSPALNQQAASVTSVAGVSCRYPSPSSSSGLAGFWQQAAAGIDVQTVVPLCKWDAGRSRTAATVVL